MARAENLLRYYGVTVPPEEIKNVDRISATLAKEHRAHAKEMKDGSMSAAEFYQEHLRAAGLDTWISESDGVRTLRESRPKVPAYTETGTKSPEPAKDS